MNVLITGGCGFIGSNLVKRCVELGWTVDVVDNLSNGHPEFITEDHSEFLADADVNRTFTTCFSSPRVTNFIEEQRYDVVFHLAALPRVSYSVEHPLTTHEINVTRTLELMNSCVGNVKRFVFASSSSVYGGASELPTSECVKKDPKSPYALQKSIVEDYLLMFNRLYGLESVSMRFFNVFGDNALGSSPYATALAAWLTAIKRGESMRSDGDGTQSRDLCHVDNVVDALVRAAKFENKLNAMTFNVGCGEAVTNGEILQYLLKRYPGSKYYEAPWRAGDVMHTLSDTTAIRDVLQYAPITKVWDGVEKTCKWYDDNWHWASKLKQSV